MTDDAVDLEIKLRFAYRRLEENDNLVKQLRASIENLCHHETDLQQRVTTLKSVQDSLLTEKLTAEHTVDKLIKEKSELAAENASLRTMVKDWQRNHALQNATDTLLSTISSSSSSSSSSVPSKNNNGSTPPTLSSSPTSTIDTEQIVNKLSSSRAIVTALLELYRRHNLSVNIHDIQNIVQTHYLTQQQQQSSNNTNNSSKTTTPPPDTVRKAVRKELVDTLADFLGIQEEIDSARSNGSTTTDITVQQQTSNNNHSSKNIANNDTNNGSVVTTTSTTATSNSSNETETPISSSKVNSHAESSVSISSSVNNKAITANTAEKESSPAAVSDTSGTVATANLPPPSGGFLSRLWSVLVGDGSTTDTTNTTIPAVSTTDGSTTKETITDVPNSPAVLSNSTKNSSSTNTSNDSTVVVTPDNLSSSSTVAPLSSSSHSHAHSHSHSHGGHDHSHSHG